MSPVHTGSATVPIARGLLAAVLLTTLTACLAPPRPITGWTKGMGASLLSVDEDFVDDRLTTFDGPDQTLNLGYRWPTYSVEGLFSFTRRGYEDDDSESSLLFGAQANYYFGVPTATTRPVIGLAGFLHREASGDESSTRPGAQGFAGVEWNIAEDLALRFGGVYGYIAEDEDNGFAKQTYFGARADFFGSLPSRTSRSASDWILRSGISWNRIDPDGQDTRNTLRIPAASVGLYYEGWMNNQLRFGADVDVHRASFGDASQTNLNVYPALEYDVLSRYRTATSVRLRALTSIRYESFDSGSSDASGTIFGYGGGARITTPLWQNYTAAAGIDYVISGENEELFSPEKNTLRLTLTFERGVTRGP